MGKDRKAKLRAKQAARKARRKDARKERMELEARVRERDEELRRQREQQGSGQAEAGPKTGGAIKFAGVKRERGTAGVEDGEEKVEIEYVAVPPEAMVHNEAYADLMHAFSVMAGQDDASVGQDADKEETGPDEDDGADGNHAMDEGEDGAADGEGQRRMTNKERKEAKRLKVALLKQLVSQPELVELHDVTAADPLLLVHLKMVPHSVPVPQHWCRKRKYLQNKRASDKIPFQLPKFIADTGVATMRDTALEGDAEKSSKQRQRERVQPKMHQIDIDYEALHNAFFRYQTKPKMTAHGDLYYENKELKPNYAGSKPGVLSDTLREALGMPEGAPPPWLVNMQRYGPPPAYPNLKIPGLNAPIPQGAEWGFEPGAWGKPPVDRMGRPLYGDVFGMDGTANKPAEELLMAQQPHWGDLGAALESSEEDEEEDSSEDAEAGDIDDAASDASDDTGAMSEVPVDMAGAGTMSVPIGMETPTGDAIEVRKQKRGSEARPLYQVLEQADASISASDKMGSSFTYVIPNAAEAGAGASPATADRGVDLMKSQATQKEVITLNPDDLSNMADQEGAAALLRSKFDARMESKKLSSARSADVSAVFAEHEAMQQKKKKKKKKTKSSYKF